MLVLGIDPGSRKTGFGLIQMQGRKAKYIASRVAKFHTKKDFLDRINDIYQSTCEIIEEYSPDYISIESLIYVKSPTALIKLAQTRGVILSALCQSGFEKRIFEYSPNFIKSQTTGHGHSDKAGGQKFLDLILGKRDYETDDESDALLIALCHAFQHNGIGTKRRKTRSGSLAGHLSHKI